MIFLIATAFIWGFLEGLCFFIVPDVALSFIALRGFKAALLSTIFTVLGSIFAAALLFFVLAQNSDWGAALVDIWSRLPGFYPKMLTVAHEHLQYAGAKGLLSGPRSGIPYRFYIFEAWGLKIPLLDLLLWTPLARLQRIFLAPTVVLGLRWSFYKLNNRYLKLKPQLCQNGLSLMVLIYWIALYIWYWGKFLPSTYTN